MKEDANFPASTAWNKILGVVRRNQKGWKPAVVDLFTQFDTDGGGSLGKDELRDALGSVGIALKPKDFDPFYTELGPF